MRSPLLFASCFLIAGLTCFAQPAAAAEGLSGLLSADEFRSAGLHKLTPEELATLEQTLRDRGFAALEAPPEKKEQLFGAEMLTDFRPSGAPESVRTRVKGAFTGWNGKTVFHLENGQVWQQRSGGSYFAVPTLQDPEVELRRGRFGYRMVVLGIRQEVLVKRIQ